MESKIIEVDSQTCDANIAECTKGAEYLLDMKHKRKIDIKQGEQWLKILKDAHPNIPEMLLWRGIDLYTYRPEVMDALCEDCKNNPDKYANEKPVVFNDSAFNGTAEEINEEDFQQAVKCQ